jgi:NAD(P)-dependent dehydrogenase (short-subunit alcohol dehydrogenase family)
MVPFYEIDMQDWDTVFAVNVRGLFLCCKAVAPDMIARRKGRIINIASEAAKIPKVNMAAYSASKAAVINLSKALALEMAPYNVNVVALCPGTTDTDLVTQKLAGGDREVIRKVELSIPLGRLASPEDQAWMVAFLSSDLSKHITGQAINVDGGQVMY